MIQEYTSQLLSLSSTLFRASYLLLSSTVNRLAFDLLGFLKAHKNHLKGETLLYFLSDVRLLQFRRPLRNDLEEEETGEGNGSESSDEDAIEGVRELESHLERWVAEMIEGREGEDGDRIWDV